MSNDDFAETTAPGTTAQDPNRPVARRNWAFFAQVGILFAILAGSVGLLYESSYFTDRLEGAQVLAPSLAFILLAYAVFRVFGTEHVLAGEFPPADQRNGRIAIAITAIIAFLLNFLAVQPTPVYVLTLYPLYMASALYYAVFKRKLHTIAVITGTAFGSILYFIALHPHRTEVWGEMIRVLGILGVASKA